LKGLEKRCILYLLVAAREMENISRGPAFGDFVTILTEGPMQDVTVARLYKVQMYKLSPLFSM
jgi:hypothetical protein